MTPLTLALTVAVWCLAASLVASTAATVRRAWVEASAGRRLRALITRAETLLGYLETADELFGKPPR